MRKVVCDTNIYISAFNFGGAPQKVVELAVDGHITVFISTPILREFERILTSKFKWSSIKASEAIANIRGFTTMVYPKQQVEAVHEDPADDRIVECALEAKADMIVSGDYDLRRLKQFQGIQILSPSEFLSIRDSKRKVV